MAKFFPRPSQDASLPGSTGVPYLFFHREAGYQSFYEISGNPAQTQVSRCLRFQSFKVKQQPPFTIFVMSVPANLATLPPCHFETLKPAFTE
jgi:hypothetical protein